MKKLLLTLGAVASIAAPVAAVVACGSTEEKTYTKVSPAEAKASAFSTVSDIMTKTGYSMDDLVKNQLATYLNKIAGDYKISVDAVEEGKVAASAADAASHGVGNFMVLLTGGPKMNVSGDDTYGATKDNLHPDTVPTKLTFTPNSGIATMIASSLTDQKDVLETRWGYDISDVENSDIVVYVQGTTLSVNRLFKRDKNLYEGDLLKGSNDKNIDETFFNKSFAVTKA